MEHTDKKPETEGHRMGQQVEQAFGLPKGTTTWLWPRKPMSGKQEGAPKNAAKGGKAAIKPPKSAGRARSGKASKRSPFPGW